MPQRKKTHTHTHKHKQTKDGTRIYHRTGSSHFGAEECAREKHTHTQTQKKQRRYTHISQLAQFMPPPEKNILRGISEIRGQPTLCQVHTSAYVSLFAPEKHCIARDEEVFQQVRQDHVAGHSRKPDRVVYPNKNVRLGSILGGRCGIRIDKKTCLAVRRCSNILPSV